jgi:hypothetical protein
MCSNWGATEFVKQREQLARSFVYASRDTSLCRRQEFTCMIC